MINVKYKKFAAALVLGSAAALTGCGSSAPPIAPPPGVAPGAQTGVGLGGCVPINQAIAFNANGIYIDWANLVGGLVPQTQRPVGTVTVTSGGAIGQPMPQSIPGQAPGMGGQYQRSGSDGTISMNVTQNAAPVTPVGQPYPTYPQNTYPAPSPYNTYQQPIGQTPSTANATGFLTISPLAQTDIMLKMGSQLGMGYGTPGQVPYPQQPGYPGAYPQTGYPQTGYPQSGYPQQQQLCVSGIAFNGGHYYSTIYGMYVYLYLNNTQHGYVLYF